MEIPVDNQSNVIKVVKTVYQHQDSNLLGVIHKCSSLVEVYVKYGTIRIPEGLVTWYNYKAVKLDSLLWV